MIIGLGSIFRNSVGYLDRYFAQARALKTELAKEDIKFRLILVEGDSWDNTWGGLAALSNDLDIVIVKRAHGGPPWGSVDDPARWAALSWCCNGVLDHVEKDVDVMIYVESDLVWDAATMVALTKQVSEQVPAISPMCFTSMGHFYDVWGYLKNGKQFGPFPPYHDELAVDGLTSIDSAGSCIVMRGDVARMVRFGPHDCVRGLGRSIWENGFSLWVDPTLRVMQT